jgi:hypothetical protein
MKAEQHNGTKEQVMVGGMMGRKDSTPVRNLWRASGTKTSASALKNNSNEIALLTSAKTGREKVQEG